MRPDNGLVIARHEIQLRLSAGEHITNRSCLDIGRRCAGVYLNSVTPGNYAFVQEVAGGIGTVLCGATLTKSSPNTGDLLNATTLGVVDDPTVQEFIPASIGIALDPPSPNTKIRVFLYGSPGLG